MASAPDAPVTISLDEFREASEHSKSIIIETPMLPARWLTESVGVPVFLKCECMQRAGSFKIRGAYNFISRLSEQQRAAGVCAASAGNHAQGVALSAQVLGIRATIFMPENAPLPKVRATEGYGAEVRLAGQTVGDCLALARQFSNATGSVFVHPFDDRDVIIGQGTLALDIVKQCPDVATVVVCTGGGGMLSGIAMAIKQLKPNARVIGVQAERAAAFPASLAAGKPVQLKEMNSIADGISVGIPGAVTFGVISQSKWVDQVLTVSEDSICQAILRLMTRNKVVVEPAGSVACAALIQHPHVFASSPGPVVVTLSGGNIEPLLLMRIMQHGLISYGRYVTFQIRTTDKPGNLASILNVIASHGANVTSIAPLIAPAAHVSAQVLNVSHNRLDATLPINEVDVFIELETRGPEHSDKLMHVLGQQGYIMVKILSAQPVSSAVPGTP